MRPPAEARQGEGPPALGERKRREPNAEEHKEINVAALGPKYCMPPLAKTALAPNPKAAPQTYMHKPAKQSPQTITDVTKVYNKSN